MERNDEGMFARSMAGHDAGRLYVIERTEGDFVYLTDGESRPLKRPKRKNRKHIQIIRKVSLQLSEREMTDEAVKRAIRDYEKESAES